MAFLARLKVMAEDGIVLHLLLSPRKLWTTLALQGWAEYVFRHFVAQKGHPFTSVSVCMRTWKSLWTKYKGLPTLSLKYRTFGLLTSSAMARISGQDSATCELCGSSNPGQVHTVLHCPALKEVREKPVYKVLEEVPLFARCTGIPTTVPLFAKPLSESRPAFMIPLASVFTDGSAYPTDLPNPRLSAWSVVVSGDHSFKLLSSGPAPGPVHTILRAETFAVLWALRSVRDLALFVDNSTVVHGLNSILSHGFDRLPKPILIFGLKLRRKLFQGLLV